MAKGHSEISDRLVSETVAPFGISLSDDQIAKIKLYLGLLLNWNKVTNLTSVTDPVEIVSRHFGESMFATSLVSMENGRLADLGSGAGFPGLALKIACPQLEVTLIESSKKKCAFLAEVVRVLGLTKVEILSRRFEDMRAGNNFANFVTVRAVGGFPAILRWTRSALSRRGHLLLWVGGEDITNITNSKGWIWNPPERIPESQRRYILVGRCLGENV